MFVIFDYPYAGFTLEIEAEISMAEPQTMTDPGCDSEFCITEIKLDGKCALDLIGFNEWDSLDVADFDRRVEEYYIFTECCEK